MGDDGLLLDQLEEKEGQTEPSDDFMVWTIGASIPLLSSKEGFQEENAPAQGLAISERLGLIFVACPVGFFVANTKDILSSAKDIKESNKASSIQEQSIVEVSLTGLLLLTLSSDSSVLAACSDRELHFFLADSLQRKVVEPIMSRELHPSTMFRDFKWDKSDKTAYVVLSSDGVLCHGDMQAQHTSVAENVEAVDWSVGGDFIAVLRGRSIFILSSDFEEKHHMKLPFPSQEDDSTMKVDCIKWIRHDSIVIGCNKSAEDGIGSGYLIRVITSNGHDIAEASQDVVILTFDNFFFCLSDSISPFGKGPLLFMHYNKFWELALATNRKSVDDHIVLLGWLPDNNLKEPKVIEFLNDKRPRIEMQENGDENMIVGFGVDVNFDDGPYQIQLEGGDVAEFAYCVMLCLTIDGMLSSFRVASKSAPLSIPLEGGNLEDQGFKCLVMQNEPNKIVPGITLNAVSGVDDCSKFVTPVSTQKPEAESIQAMHSSQVGKEQSSQRTYATGNLVPLNFEQSAVEKSSTLEAPQLRSSINTWTQKSLPSKPDIKSTQDTNQSQAKVEQCSERGNSTAKLGFLNIPTSAVANSNKPHQFPEHGNSLNMGIQKPFPSTTRIEDIGGLAMQKNSLMANEPTSQSSLKIKEQDKSLLEQRFNSFDMKNSSASPQHPELVGSSQGISRLSKMDSISSSLLEQKSLDMRVKLQSPVVLDSEAAFSNAFENVREIAEELDHQFSIIEGEGNYGVSDTVFRKDCVLAIEESIRNLSKRCRDWKNKMDDRLDDVHHLQNGVMHAIAKEVHIKGTIRQTSKSQYWELWNHQKLRPEFEHKRQKLLKTKLNLIKQLRDLERHFNVLELNKFGDQDYGSRGKTYQNSGELSRRGQELQRLYNTMNSQLAISNQLSECLSRQMAALSIAPCNVKQREIKKELFESIGLDYDGSGDKSPHIKGNGCPSPPSNKLSFSSVCTPDVDHASKATNMIQYFEPETARRRRDSVDMNFVGFNPPKTVVKRIFMEEFADDTADKFVHERSRKNYNSPLEHGLVESPEAIPLHWTSSTRGLRNGYPANEATRISETSPSSFFKLPKSKLEPSQSSVMISRGVSIPRPNDLPSTSSPPSLISLNNTKGEGRAAYKEQDTVALGTSKALIVGNKTEPLGKGNNGSFPTSSAINEVAKVSTHATIQGTTISSRHLEGTGHGSGHKLPTISSMDTLLKDVQAPKLHALSSMPPANPSGKGTQLTQHMGLVQSEKSVSTATISSAMPISFPASTYPGNLPISTFSSPLSTSKLTHDPQENHLTFVPTSTSIEHSSQSNEKAKEVPSTNISPPSTASQPAVLVSPLSTPIQMSSQASPSFGSASTFTSFVHASSVSPDVIPPPSNPSSSSQSTSPPGKSESISSPASVEVNLPMEPPVQIGLPLGHVPQLSQGSKPPYEGSLSSLEAMKSLSSPSSTVLSEPSSSSSTTLHVSSQLSGHGPSALASKPDILPTSSADTTATASPGFSFGTQANFLSTSSFNMFSSVPGVSSSSQHATLASTALNEIMDTAANQEDDMEEEASELTTSMNLGPLGGFGLGSVTPSVPRSNPFGSLPSVSTQSNTTFSLSVPPGELFKPASFSLPAAHPSQSSVSNLFSGPFGGPAAQTSQPSGSNLFSGPFGGPSAQTSQPSGSNMFSAPFGQPKNTMSGNSAFGQPAQLGPGQQAMGSVLGTFGQSRQFGVGLPGAGSSSSSAFGGGFSASAAGSGFARAAAGGGFAALSTSGGGFAAAAAAGTTANTGGFSAFSSNAGGINAASNPLSDRFTQMRR